jgi:hypothetical protein
MMQFRDGEIDDGELRVALKEYLKAKYDVGVVDGLKVEKVRDGDGLRPDEYRVRFWGSCQKRTDGA